jgi:hypothetical protein
MYSPAKSVLLLLAVVIAAALILRFCSSGFTGAGSGGDCILEFSYEIGEIDPGFGLSRTEVERAVNDALALWGTAVKRINVTRGPGAENLVQFLYDGRQQYTDLASDTQQDINSRVANIRRMQAEYQRQVGQIERENEEYENYVNTLHADVERINEWIEEVNESGGFTEAQMRELERRREALNRRQDTESRMRAELQRSVDRLNRMGEDISREVERNQELTEQFHEEFGREFSFSSADYRRENGQGIISIYQFTDKRQLKVLLAHEIGHALGLDHVENSQSIMYEYIRDQLNGQRVRLSPEDKAAIIEQC